LSAALVSAPASLQAGSVLLETPTEYAPGDAFTVGVRLSAVSNLALYNIELVFRTSGQPASLLTISPPEAPASGYVFPSTEYFLATPQIWDDEYRITLGDFLLTSPGVDVLPGVNDLVAVLTVSPAAGLIGPITVFVDSDSLFLDDPEGSSLLTPGTPPSALVTQTQAVPAPGSLVGALIGLTTLAGYGAARGRTRPAPAPPAAC